MLWKLLIAPFVTLFSLPTRKSWCRVLSLYVVKWLFDERRLSLGRLAQFRPNDDWTRLVLVETFLDKRRQLFEHWPIALRLTEAACCHALCFGKFHTKEEMKIWRKTAVPQTQNRVYSGLPSNKKQTATRRPVGGAGSILRIFWTPHTPLPSLPYRPFPLLRSRPIKSG